MKSFIKKYRKELKKNARDVLVSACFIYAIFLACLIYKLVCVDITKLMLA